MEQPQNFRSAFNGFNREDVVHYLEFLNNKHNSERIQLNQEADQLRARLNAVDPTLESRCRDLEAQLDAANAEKAELKAQLAALEAKLDAQDGEKTQRIAQLEAQLQQAQSLREQPAAEKEQPAVFHNSTMHELEAYRRAERAERMAKERAEQIYRQTNGILADATVKVEEAAKQIGSVTDQVMAQLNLLQCAVGSSRLALQEAASTMYSLCPEDEAK